MAVIVNDRREVNIDAQQVAREGGLSRTEERLVEMSRGCICCTLREDLMLEAPKLAREKRFDYLLIESTGISEPLPVAQTLFIGQDLDEPRIRQELTACLCTEKKLGQWQCGGEFADRWPQF